MIKYYFTTFGDVYAGVEATDTDFHDFKIIVQADKLQEYNALNPKEKTLDKIKEYASVFPVSTYVGQIGDDKIPHNLIPHIGKTWKMEYDRKVMFIIGAGASANCIIKSKNNSFEEDDLRPPLGNDLFNSRFKKFYEKYEGVKLSLPNLQQANVNVEEYLEEEWIDVHESGNSSVMKRHINIQFYLQEILREISCRISTKYYQYNLFANLADKLQKIYAKNSKKHFAFVSFNQDDILETFLSKYFKKQLNSIDDYVEANDSPICIFKLHGSWNWGWQFPNKVENRPKWLYDNNVNFFQLYFKLLGNYFDMVDWNSWGIELGLSEHRKGKLTIDKSKLTLHNPNGIVDFFPAILLPYRDKDEFTMPPMHYNQLIHYLTCVETLFIIGWKGNEALFNKMLNLRADKIKKVIIVDPNPETVEGNLKNILIKSGVEKIYYNSFEEFIKRGLDKEFNYT
jgi:hypothetical protein